jgi:hypothetical protein
MGFSYWDGDQRRHVDLASDHERICGFADGDGLVLSTLSRVILVLLDRVRQLEARNDREDAYRQEQNERQ